MHEVIFTFENGGEVRASVQDGLSLLEAARAANVAIDAPCSGNGSCGKCRVKLLKGEVSALPTAHLTAEELADGWRLACGCKVIGDITVMVPDIASAYQSRMKTADLSTGEEVAIFEKLMADVADAGIQFQNSFDCVQLTVDEPTLDDTMPDNERLARALAAQLGVETVEDRKSVV